MTARYRKELSRLENVYEAAFKADINQLNRVVEAWSETSMQMIGSGGSLSTASFAAWLHEYSTNRLSRAASPLDFLGNQTLGHGVACFSASGRNRDIGAAFKSAAVRGVTPLSALVMSEQTPLHAMSEKYAYSDVVSITDESFKDGFLAVATMIASSVLLLKSYAQVASDVLSPPPTLSELLSATLVNTDTNNLAQEAAEIAKCQYISVLHSSAFKPAAIDLESRFVEASLGAIHAADLRNFGHGRHFWFATRGDDTGLLAMYHESDQKLAERTIDLLPCSNVVSVLFKGPIEWSALSALLVALHVSVGAGVSAGIDPGKPGVPEFGRKLYRLGPSPSRVGPSQLNKLSAIASKTGGSVRLKGQPGISWEEAYERTLANFRRATIKGIVLDYDGTLCDQARRFEAMPLETAVQIERLVKHGAMIAVATGRGPSAGKAMRASIDPDHWSSIVIGYYNGALITSLDNDEDPLLEPMVSSNPLLREIKELSIFKDRRMSANDAQISISLESERMTHHAISASARVLRKLNMNTAQIVASSHSVDLLLKNQSKLDVVDAVAERAGCTPDEILRIGDKGAWPGNDCDLLDHALGLTVDEASVIDDTCWRLAPAGMKGLQAAIYYLSQIEWHNKMGKIALQSRPARKQS